MPNVFLTFSLWLDARRRRGCGKEREGACSERKKGGFVPWKKRPGVFAAVRQS